MWNPPPMTKVDPKACLVVIDIQKGICARKSAPHSVESVIEQCGKLQAAFHAKNMPVFLVNVIPSEHKCKVAEFSSPAPQLPADFGELLLPKGNDICVTKKTWSAFPNTKFEELLAERGVTQIVICGVATSIGVDATARDAVARGYSVVYAEDAMTDMDGTAHQVATQVIFPKNGHVQQVADLCTMISMV